jgi:hypothetical protein
VITRARETAPLLFGPEKRVSNVHHLWSLLSGRNPNDTLVMTDGKTHRSPKLTITRIISLASLLLAIIAVFLALKKPQALNTPQTPTAVAANAQSFQSKVDQMAQAQVQGQSGAEVHLTAGEVSAAFAQASDQGNASPAVTTPSAATPAPAASADASAALVSGSFDPANMPEPVVTFEGDQVKGQFLTEVGGKKVYVTVAGHLGAKDGYANFQPTEFKVGDLNVPVSLVNDALQKKMLEQRDKLKLPDYISDIRVENGELVVKQK